MHGSMCRSIRKLPCFIAVGLMMASTQAAIEPNGRGLLDGCDEAGAITEVRETECVSDRRVDQRQEPTIGETDVSVESRASFEASTVGQTAKFSFGTDRKKKPWQTNDRTWMVTLTGKIDDKEDAALLGDLDGLTSGVSASYRYNLLWWDDLAAGSKADQAAIIRQKICDKDLVDRKKVFEEHNPGQRFTEDGRICSRTIISGPNKDLYIAQWVEQVETLRQFSSLSLQVKANYAKYDYFDTATLEKADDNETGVSASATYAKLTASGNVVFAGGRWERSFEAQDKVQRCTPGPVPGVETCDTQPFGPPKKNNKIIAYTEYRVFISGKYAVSPRVSYDFDDSTLGIRVPVYMVRNAKGSLSGGLRFDWNSKDEDIIISVFVSAPIKLLAP